MNRMTAIAVYVALTACPGMFAHAQATSTLYAKPDQTQRAGESVIRCAHNDRGSHALQPCSARQSEEATRLGSDVTRQEIECVLSGVCGVAERGRVNG
jgi:hypothetical protein